VGVGPRSRYRRNILIYPCIFKARCVRVWTTFPGAALPREPKISPKIPSKISPKIDPKSPDPAGGAGCAP
jgi:hypothetical protein